MFGPWIEIFMFLKELLPSKKLFTRPQFNFLTLHYVYLISFAILSSIILYPAKNMAYIDALFFSSGAATQSGLNTVDVNTIYLYQQVVLYFVACFCNPIFINTFVVFVRLYWFEKRFQNLVLEAQKLRRTKTRERGETLSRSGTFSKPTDAPLNPDFSLEERGFGPRKIMVMRPDDDIIHNVAAMDEKSRDSDTSGDASGSGSTSNHERNQGMSDEVESDPAFVPQPFRREITFADEIRPVRDGLNGDRLPSKFSTEQHLAILEAQRNPKDNDVLYIPGPRDFDRGDIPQQINEGEELEMLKQHQRSWSGEHNREGDATDSHLEKSNSASQMSAAKMSVFSRLRQRGREPTQERRDPSDDDDMSGLRRRRGSFARYLTSSDNDDETMPPYLSWQPTIGRNSTFVDLTEEQREELGGIEYRALKTLAIVLCTYFIGFHVLGIVCFLPWILRSGPYYQGVLEESAINGVWWGIFTPASCFNDLGYTLTPDSMNSFDNAIFPLLLGSFLILIGNTGFPCMLRFVIWAASKCVPRSSAIYEELRFLLDHPRRCFTLLFPSKATWWLFWILVLLNGLDLLFFIILDLHDPVVTVLSPGIRVLDGWFQATSTRTAGFSVVNIAGLHPAIQVSYLVMMYISAFPIAISVRRTNVYEERSLGLYGGEDSDENGNQSYVGDHLRRQLSFDLWFVFLGFFIISIVEGGRLSNTNEYAFTLFSVLFEIVSSYGTVGLSLGYPGIDASFSAEFAVLSKLIIIAMQVRGRHRGLPYALDKAILLPSEGLQKKEIEHENRRRRGSTVSQVDFGNRSAANLSAALGTPTPANLDARRPSRDSIMQSTNNDRSKQPHPDGGHRFTTLLSQVFNAGPASNKKFQD